MNRRSVFPLQELFTKIALDVCVKYAEANWMVGVLVCVPALRKLFHAADLAWQPSSLRPGSPSEKCELLPASIGPAEHF